MSWILIDTGARGWTKRADHPKGHPAMLDGYYVLPADRAGDRGVPSGVRTPMAIKPAGWDDLAALLPDVTSGRRGCVVSVARALLAEVIA